MRKNKWLLTIYLMVVFILLPLGVEATTFYVDFVNGSDQNTGTSSSSPFMHSPGDSNATGTAGSTSLTAGDVVLFKKGVTYAGQITVNGSGSLVTSGSSATVSTGGVLSETSANFTADGVKAGDWVYIYHSKNSQTNTWVESTGLFEVAGVPGSTSINLTNFTGIVHTTPEMTYLVYRPIQFTSDPGFGSGAATLTGSNTRTTIFGLGSRNYIMIKDLSLVNTYDDGNSDSAAIKTTSNITGLSLINCELTDLGVSGIRTGLNARYLVTMNNRATRVAYNGIGGLGDNNLHDGNTIIGPGARGGLAGYRYTIIRNNYVKDMTQAYGGKHQDGIGFIDGGPDGDNAYGWIYNNIIDNTVEFLALYEPGGGTKYWTVHSNVFIGREPDTDYGDAGILMRGSDNNKIYNNLFYAVSGRGFVNCIRLTTNTNVSIINNIFLSKSTTSTMLNIPSGSSAGLIVENNQYYHPGNEPILYSGSDRTFSQWQGLGFDSDGTHFRSEGPKFSSQTSLNFRLQFDSPAINAGMNLDTFFTLDKGGFSREGFTWDVGPFEFGDVRPSNPTNLTIMNN